ncbi:MAG: adenosylcobinamide amidohydrolase [Nitrospinae bacterium]|nr:adenosylcobinamide amidohydrolase [Nitrospinota bacterium]MDA1108729.1 adenosylcobinamide amidohydrolase [Nitrospinota bacterium]
MEIHNPETACSKISTTLAKNTLIIKFPEPWPVLSWAPHNGGNITSSCVFNHQLGKFDEKDLDSIFNNVTNSLNLPKDAIGLITGAEIQNYRECVLTHNSLWVHGIVTVGLANARTAGDEADVPFQTPPNPVGTINLVLACNALPDISGKIEAVHVATMAKARALRDMDVMSEKSGLPATGTGTDCIVVAGTGEIQENYCGMHTVLGELIGKVVYRVITGAI